MFMNFRYLSPHFKIDLKQIIYKNFLHVKVHICARHSLKRFDYRFYTSYDEKKIVKFYRPEKKMIMMTTPTQLLLIKAERRKKFPLPR